MNNSASITDLYVILQRIERKLEPLKQKQTWVGFSFIEDLTGWNAEKRRQAVKQGIMKKKKGENLYDAYSIPDRFLKKQTDHGITI